MMCKVIILFSSFLVIIAKASDVDADCDKVLFESIDQDLKQRTMVVEDKSRHRTLVLTDITDTSEPCTPRWWLDHNPQGTITCLGAAVSEPSALPHRRDVACAVEHCKPDSSRVDLGYVRTMLASALFVPEPHTMAAICIELGCKSRVRRVRVPGTLLEAAPEIRWQPRPSPGPQKALVIGLGTTTMTMWLREALPGLALHVAELAPSVAKAASCFGLDAAHDPSLHIHVADGRRFLQNSTDGEYDVIMVDAFDSNASLPRCFRTTQFFQLAKRKLASGGVLSFNFLMQGPSLRVAKGLVSTFGSTHVWMGDAPGAEGMQSIIAAFAPGHPKAHSDSPSSAVEAKPSEDGKANAEQALNWFHHANFRPLRRGALDNVTAFEDATECVH